MSVITTVLVSMYCEVCEVSGYVAASLTSTHFL